MAALVGIEPPLLWVGKERLRFYNTWELTEAQRTVERLWERYTDILQPKSNHRLNRFNLQRYRQETLESVDEFMTHCSRRSANSGTLGRRTSHRATDRRNKARKDTREAVRTLR
ncbi:hypothetical protein LSAT2_013950 [Lamellibrachia satsuma]|nr:hypothetical protein LSAT2_013950 [Lamellibrachia satsuma]